MAGDLNQQLRVLGTWFEDEAGVSLSSPMDDLADRTGAGVMPADRQGRGVDRTSPVSLVDIETRESTTDERVGRRWLRWTVAAAAAVVLVIVAIAAFRGTEESSPVDVVDSPEDTGTPDPPDPPVMDTSEPWDLQFISDGLGTGVARAWAERIEQDMGVEVRVHDDAHLSEDDSAVGLLERLEAPDSRLVEQIVEAEIIAVFANPVGSGVGEDAWTCISTSAEPRDPPMLYSEEDFVAYGEDLRSIFTTVFELRDGAPTIVRAMDSFVPTLDEWRAAGVEAECMAIFELISDTTRAAAAELGIPTASMLDAFNGPDHDEDPREKGLVGPGGTFASVEEGREAMVDVLHGLGYEPTGHPA